MAALAMKANELLIWMSARGEGSWQQFRAVVEELHLDESESDEPAASEDENWGDASSLPLYQDLRLNLQRLGHAEFFAGAGEKEWRVTPPSLAATEIDGGWRGSLAGARSPNLLRRVSDAAINETLEETPHPGCPDLIRVHTSDLPSMAAVAQNAGLLFQQHAPAAILASLPAIDDPAVRRAVDLPLGSDWKIERFSTRTQGWRVTTRDDALSARSALFRFALRYRRVVLFCSKGVAYELPEAVGKYLMLMVHRRRVLSYDRLRHKLILPARFRPPFLVERALILCSGIPPFYNSEDSSLHYTDVPPFIADLAFALLRQGRPT